MSALTPITVDGIQTLAHYEYTSGPVKQTYYQLLIPFINLLNLTQQGTTPVAQQVTQQDVDNIRQAIAGFQELAKNGLTITDPTDPTKTVKSYMSVQMANDLDLLLRSVRSTGVDATYSNLDLTHLQLWRDIAVQSSDIYQIVVSAQTDALYATRTLQSLTQTIYVATGNEIIGATMKSLEKALSLTQDVLNTLASLQNVKNQITVVALKPFSTVFNIMQPAASATQYQQLYSKAASGYFGRPITPQLLSTLSKVSTNEIFGGDALISVVVPGIHFGSTVLQLIQLRDKMKEELIALSAQGPQSVLSNPDSLFSRLKSVYDDLNKNLVRSDTGAPAQIGDPGKFLLSGVSNWLLDNYSTFNNPNATLAGQIQQNLTFAITSAESLNDSQKESVRRYLFVFQQYYQSASQVLTALNQIIQKMAGNIAR